jgi:Rad3-related DNA helicase
MQRFIGSDQRDWVHWSDRKKLIFRPLSAAKYAQDFLFSRADMVVIMSATILDFDVFCRTLGLLRADCERLALPSDFPVNNRPIFYSPAGSMSWRNKDATLPKVAEKLRKLLGIYSNQKGLIHTNSYPMNQYFVKALTAAGLGKRIITHGAGGAEAAIQRHRSETGPTVLCSPAMTEGLDLPDDLSRFQVVVKVPYPNFKDPYVAARKKRDNRWYDWQTAMRLIQATGRSVRSETDFAETYILDQDFAVFRERSRNLFPPWWLEAIREPEGSPEPNLNPRGSTGPQVVLKNFSNTTRSFLLFQEPGVPHRQQNRRCRFQPTN